LVRNLLFISPDRIPAHFGRHRSLFEGEGRMARILLTVAICALGVRAEMVGDFAPLAVGNKWVYEHQVTMGDDYGGGSTLKGRQTLQITATEMSGDTLYYKAKITFGNDTLHFTGHLANTPDTVYPGYVKDIRFTDAGSSSVFFRDERKGVNSTYSYFDVHRRESAAVTKVPVGGDSAYVYYGEYQQAMIGNFTYLQNVGMIIQEKCDCGFYGGSLSSLKLLAFNGKKINADSLQAAGRAWYRTTGVAPRSKRALRPAANARRDGAGYSADGRRVEFPGRRPELREDAANPGSLMLLRSTLDR
jgi:hypothetical protein